MADRLQLNPVVQRLRKVTPAAVAGRWRCVTTPPTRTRLPSSAVDNWFARRMPCSQGGPDVPDRVVVRRDPGGPQVGHRRLHPGHPRQHRWQYRTAHADRCPRSLLGGTARVPQRLPPGQPERVERPRRRQSLHLYCGQSRPADQVGHVRVRAVLLPLLHDGGRRGQRADGIARQLPLELRPRNRWVCPTPSVPPSLRQQTTPPSNQPQAGAPVVNPQQPAAARVGRPPAAVR